MARAAFLGLGAMGSPMAGHLAKKGHKVTVWNRTTDKAAKWSDNFKGDHKEDPADAVFGAEFVFLCLGDDPDVEEVFDKIDASLGGGMVVVDHTTASAGLAHRLAKRSQKRGAAFLDAPISGGEAGAQKGALTIMCGGTLQAFEKAHPVMSAYGHRITRIGDSGSGQLAKSVNQICIAGLLQGLSEGLHFAEQAGLDVDTVIEAISGGAAQSWQMDNRAKTMAQREFEFGFAIDWMRKDLRIALEAARGLGARLPVTALVDEFYADVQAAGGQRWDTSALITRLAAPAEK